MFKKIAAMFAAGMLVWMGACGLAFAQVEVNKADQATLETVKGIGPSTSAKILDARKKGGPFKSWPDFAERVNGVGDKTAVKLSDGGLTVNGQSLANAGVVPAFAAKSGHDKPGAVAPQPMLPSKAAGSAVRPGPASVPAPDRPQPVIPTR